MVSPGPVRSPSEQFLAERARLLAVLGDIPSGGIVEDIEHIGATSVQGLPGRDCIDLALSTWPFPLSVESIGKLEELGYRTNPAVPAGSQQVMIHTSGACQLFILEAGSEKWSNFRILRDYWRANEKARQQYARLKQAWLAGHVNEPEGDRAEKQSFFSSVLERAREWWVTEHGFRPLDQLVETMQGFEPTWLLGGGWALDLFLGRAARIHEDVDVVVASDDQLALQSHMVHKGWSLMVPSQGKMEPWKEPVKLDPGQHQVHAFRDGAFIDFLLSPIRDGVWHYRRDPAVIRSMQQVVMRDASGMPFLAPEIVLLFKSRNTSGRERPKDQLDFERIRPQLEPERRAWLLWALIATATQHPWVEKLTMAA